MSRQKKIHPPLNVGFGEALVNIAAGGNPKAKPKITDEHKVEFLSDLLYMIDQVTLHQRYYSSTTDKELSKNILHIEPHYIRD